MFAEKEVRKFVFGRVLIQFNLKLRLHAWVPKPQVRKQTNRVANEGLSGELQYI